MTWHVYVSKCTNVRQSKVGSLITIPMIIVIAAADGIDRDDVGVIMILMVMMIVLMQ